MPSHKIMIVEDEKIVAADIHASIEKMGYAVCAMASSGMEAIKKADSSRPDLILMDILLKGSMDGIEAATRIKELYKIPVIYLTAFGDDSILQRAKVTEPYGYITKPFNDRELHIAIEIAIYKKHAEMALQEAHDLLELRVEERTKQLNESLSQAEELTVRAEAANRAKSLFMGNMSHELRTPLSGVLGMTEALLNTPLADKQRDYAEKIMKSGEALLVVVGNILDFSRIEAGKMVLESSPFQMETVIANVVNLFVPAAAEEKIGLHAIIDPELPAVRGDAHRLTQVVSNLLGNAVKFTKKGEIRVEVKILRRTEAEIDLAIGVQDTGIGMTEEELSRIFTPFTQGDTTTGRRFGGTGLGLTISRNLVELMGGTLQVESVSGKGSLFTVLLTFPIAQGFARSDFKSVPINPVAPATPARPELPPGDMAELQTLLEKLKEPLDNGEPMPCKKILATLLQKSWPEEQKILLAELNRLIKHYRLQEALDLLNAKK